MKTVEELEAELETVTRERDLSLFAWESAGMTGRDAQSAMLELARQLEEARAEIVTLTAALDERDLEAERGLEQYDRLVRERDEARAEVERLTDERDELLVRVANQDAELRATREVHNGARAEVERLRAGKHTRDCRKQSAYNVACVCGADDAKRAEVAAAYRRGAEAMREACANAFAEYEGAGLSAQILAMELPIPEEP